MRSFKACYILRLLWMIQLAVHHLHKNKVKYETLKSIWKNIHFPGCFLSCCISLNESLFKTSVKPCETSLKASCIVVDDVDITTRSLNSFQESRSCQGLVKSSQLASELEFPRGEDEKIKSRASRPNGQYAFC